MSEGTILELIPDFQRHLRLRRRAPRTIEVYTETLKQVAVVLPQDVTEITRVHIEDYLLARMEVVAPATVATDYGRLHSFFGWLLREEFIAESPMARIVRPTVEEKPRRVLPAEEVEALFKACQGDRFEDRRDLAIVTFLYDTGARRGAITNLTLDDIDQEQQLITVTEKGNRVRHLRYGDAAAQVLSRYLRQRRKHPFHHRPELWLGVKGGLSPNGVQQMLERRGTSIGIKVHAHLFRHTFAHQWLANGGNEGDLMYLLGWRSRKMLDRYGAEAAEGRAQAAHARLSPADRLRGT